MMSVRAARLLAVTILAIAVIAPVWAVKPSQLPEQWRKWLGDNRGRIFFTDVGGYKFRVVPAGYLLDGNSASTAPAAK